MHDSLQLVASGKRRTDDLDATADALLVASRALVGVAARTLPDSAGVTLQQYRVLVLLFSEGGTTVGRLAIRLGVHQSSVTRLCDRLAGKELIKRTSGIEDRREIQISLSAAGRRLVERVSAQRRDELREVAARMSVEARQQAVAGLLAFAEAAGERTFLLDPLS